MLIDGARNSLQRTLYEITSDRYLKKHYENYCICDKFIYDKKKSLFAMLECHIPIYWWIIPAFKRFVMLAKNLHHPKN